MTKAKERELVTLVRRARDAAAMQARELEESSNPQVVIVAREARARADAFTTVLEAMQGNAVALKIEADGCAQERLF